MIMTKLENTVDLIKKINKSRTIFFRITLKKWHGGLGSYDDWGSFDHIVKSAILEMFDNYNWQFFSLDIVSLEL